MSEMKIRELLPDELEDVQGGWIANAIGAAVVDRRAPRRGLRREPRGVARDLDRVAVEVRQVRQDRAEPRGVVAAHEEPAHRSVEARRGHRLAQRGEVDPLGGHAR